MDIDPGILEQEAILRKASDAYYNGNPIMSDAEFDDLWRAHQKHRADHPDLDIWKDTILDRVGAAPRAASGFRKVKHRTPMMSLDNVFVQADGDRLAELFKWFAKLDLGDMASEVDVIVEPKIDGLSASVIYENGILARVVTRGDGEEGDDITTNALAAGLVPPTIIPDAPWNGAGTSEDPSGIVEVRGEIYMTFGAFEVECEMARVSGKALPANPRNAAAGIIRRKDASMIPPQALKFLVHGYETPRFDTYLDDRAAILKAGLSVPSFASFKLDSPPDFDTLDKLAVHPYPTDGLVFKLDSYKLRKALGFTSRAPRWAIALKLEQEQVETTCNAITVQVGRSGVLTPVAELEPVEVDGSVVSRATLHNETQVNRIGLCVGDRVVLQKAGGIIPEIVMSLTKRNRERELTTFHGNKDVNVPAVILDQMVAGSLEQERPRFSLLKHIDHKCPSCGSHDILVDGDIEESMVAAELKRQANSFDIESDGKLNLGKVRKRMQEIIASLSDATVRKLQTDNGCDDMTLDVFRNQWLSDVVANITADGLRYSCGNPSCEAKMAARIEHMASRGCLNIDQLGGELATALAEGRGMGGAPKYHPFEILEKQAPWFARISWTTESGGTMTVGESRAARIRTAIENAKKLPLNRWIAACGIPSVGENTSKEISRLFKDARELMLLHKDAAHGLDTDSRRIEAVRHIAMGGDKADPKVADYKISHHLGPVSAQSLIDFIESVDGVYVLPIMVEHGITSDNWDPIPAEVQVSAETPLVGKSFCVTGTLSVPREEIHAMIRAAGGTIVSSVSKKTNVLVAGEKAGSKLKKAADLGVEVWSEAELRGLLS